MTTNITNAQRDKWLFEQLYDYVGSSAFKARCADVRARQDAGEEFDPAQLADALGVPPDLVSIWLLQLAEQTIGRVIVPDNGRIQ